jgi:hypothetical protein
VLRIPLCLFQQGIKMILKVKGEALEKDDVPPLWLFPLKEELHPPLRGVVHL